MATIKIVHFKSKKYKDKSNPIMLRLTIDRKVKYFSLPDKFSCQANQWDKRNGCFKNSFPGYDKANKRLMKIMAKVQDIQSDLNTKNNDQGFTFEEFAERFVVTTEKLFLFQYFDTVIERLEKAGKVGNADVYRDVKSQFKKYFGADIEMKSITLKHLNLYAENCIADGHRDTTIHYRMRTLRALFNRARKEQGLENYPFEKFDWSRLNLQTEKRAISKNDLLKIYNHKLEPGDPFFDSRNIFLFMYFSYGLNFGDLAKLEPKNIIKDEAGYVLSYYRSKTRRLLKIPLNEYSLKIVQFYTQQNFGNRYIFPVLNPEIHQTPKQIRTRIQTALKLFNKEIRELAQSLGIEKHITSYVARHSFATILKKENIGTSIISEMMGHSSESVTQTYLDSFDNSTKTEAAKKLI
jgi:integrase/recombinase XerD